MKSKFRIAFRHLAASACFGLVGLFGLPQAAHSAPITFNGAQFELTLVGQSGSTYDFKYSADFSGWNGSGQDFVAAVNFKPDTGMVATSFELVSTTAPGNWTTSQANANNNGCQGGSDSFICSEVDPVTSAPTTTGAMYEWLFQLTYESVLNDGAFSNAPLRAWFVDGEGRGAGLLSTTADITRDVPEPAALFLLGIGLVGVRVASVARGRTSPGTRPAQAVEVRA